MLTYEQSKKIALEVNQTLDFMKKQSKLSVFANRHLSFDTNYGALYSNTTEDLGGYYQEFGNPKTFLTVAASGDQILNAVLHGAQKIDAFDINFLAKRACALKIAAVEALPKEELLKFYREFSFDTFMEVKKYLPPIDAAYWYAIFDWCDSDDIARYLFVYEILPEEMIKSINPYLNGQKYQEVQQKLNNVDITYHDCDFYSLASRLKDQTFDGMNFSNIYEYLNYSTQVSLQIAQQFKEYILSSLYPHLNQGGSAMISYMYAFNDQVKKEFDQYYTQRPNDLIKEEFISPYQIEAYAKEITSQNLAYSQLIDVFADATSNVKYGQSIDNSHDLALILKK